MKADALDGKIDVILVKSVCTTPTPDDETIKNAYLKALNILLKDKDVLINNLLLVKEKLLDVNLSKPIEKAKNEMLIVSGL